MLFIVSMISLLISLVGLGVMAYFGIEQYGNNTEDDDAEKTVSDLRKILLGLVIVIIVSLGIMAFSHYTEKPVNVQPVQVEAK